MTNEELRAHIDERLDAMQDASANRNAETNGRIDKLYSLMPDTAQAMANVEYIFRPDGPWKEMTEKVEKHHAVYVAGRRMGLLVAAIFSWLGWDTVKNHLHLGGK
jgi:hypothetical protein